MQKFLLLLRHAQSAEKQPGQFDKDRDLTPAGIKEAIQTGAYIERKKIVPDVIFTSKATRAVTTCRFVSDALKFDTGKIFEDEELYNASVRTFYEFIRNLDDMYNNVLCIGHNPVISYLAEYLTREEIGDMETAGLVIIRFNVNQWKDVNQGSGEFIEYVNPRLLMNE